MLMLIAIKKLDHKEGWVPKNWCFWTVVLEKNPESTSDSKEIKPVHPKGDQSWIFIRRTDALVEVQHFGHLMQRANSLEKTLMLGKIEGRRGWQRMRWMASPMLWTWTWANSRRYWGTGKPDMLQSMGSQRIGHDLVTEQQQQAYFHWACSQRVLMTTLHSFFLSYMICYIGLCVMWPKGLHFTNFYLGKMWQFFIISLERTREFVPILAKVKN